MKCAGYTRWPGPDNGNLACFRRRDDLVSGFLLFGQFLIRHKPFKIFYGYGLVQVGPAAIFLTWTHTDTPDNSRKRQARTNNIQRILKPALFDTFDITGNVQVNWTGFHTRRRDVGMILTGRKGSLCVNQIRKLLREIGQGLQNRQGTGLPDTALGRTMDRLGDVSQIDDV